MTSQPPSGGCVLKPYFLNLAEKAGYQPPSGGCVLKQTALRCLSRKDLPAAFGRLCVETLPSNRLLGLLRYQPPSGGCVLKPSHRVVKKSFKTQPPSGGCVLKLKVTGRIYTCLVSSRLRAAVC